MRREIGKKWVAALMALALPLIWLPAARGETAVSVTLNEKELPSSPGYQLIHATARVGEKEIALETGIFLPPAYFKNKQPMPLIMTLHNGGEATQILTFEGLAMLVAKDDPDLRGTGKKPKNAMNLRTEAQFIALAPKLPGDYRWETPDMARILDALITQVGKAYRVDMDRVYLTGFSYGGSSTWRVAMLLPERFAAIAPLDGRATPDPLQDVKKLRDVGIYLSVGGADPGFIPEAERMRDALVADKHLRFVYRVVPGANHWGYPAVYTDPDFWKWMFAQSRHGVMGSAGPANTGEAAQPAEASHPTPGSRTILCQYWRDLPGKTVKDLTDDPAFPQFPDEQVYLDQMEIPANQEPGYGTALRGLLRAPQTGDYTFYIASDNQGELWLSDDEKAEHIKRMAAVADWSLPRDWMNNAGQQSKAVHLEAGKSYYIVAMQKSGGGDNHLAVAWKLPDGTMEGPIPGSRFAAVPSLVVPPAAVTSSDPKELPARAGLYRMKMEVEYLGRVETIGVTVVLPHDFPAVKPPALVFYADTDREGDKDGFRTQGPVQELSGDGKLAAWSPLVVIAPQCMKGQSWDTQWMQHATAAMVEKLLYELQVDEQAVYLTGSGTGGTAVWKMAEMMPGRFAAVAPICAWEVKDPRLAAALDGSAVHIITGVKNGMVTDCANRMKSELAGIHPEAEVVYEMKMGSEVAEAYYARQNFYQWMLGWRREKGKAAIQK